MKKVFLYGAPGSGKSTIGKILAQNLNVPFIDLDTEIESAAGSSISAIISSSGEIVFRDRESSALVRVCTPGDVEKAPANSVVALGGGALLRKENLRLAEAVGDVIFLDTHPEVLVKRLSTSQGDRPLLGGNLNNRLLDLLEKRKEHYSSFKMRVATNFIRTNSIITKKPEEIAWEIQKTIGRFHLKSMRAGYDVVVEPGGLDLLGFLLAERKLNTFVVVVCDENVDKQYGNRVVEQLQGTCLSVKKLVIPAGEEYKTLDTIGKLWRGFLESGLDRSSTVVALGGGVVGDLAGFAAATFMRGCQWVAVPTTLLAMVDASTGGKTGFDLPEGKNLVGAFYPPRLVLADPLVLRTLPDAELISGMAEVVKHGVISDPELFDFCSKGLEAINQDLTNLVRRAIAVKVQVIEQDPFEKGIRASLNLGHTIGHAIEIVSRFQFRHGESVAIGMVAEARLAEKLGLADEGYRTSEKIKTTLAIIGLPTEIPKGMDRSAIIKAMKVDKKKEGGDVKFALPVNIGKVQVGVRINDLESVL